MEGRVAVGAFWLQCGVLAGDKQLAMLERIFLQWTLIILHTYLFCTVDTSAIFCVAHCALRTIGVSLVPLTATELRHTTIL